MAKSWNGWLAKKSLRISKSFSWNYLPFNSGKKKFKWNAVKIEIQVMILMEQSGLGNFTWLNHHCDSVVENSFTLLTCLVSSKNFGAKWAPNLKHFPQLWRGISIQVLCHLEETFDKSQWHVIEWPFNQQTLSVIKISNIDMFFCQIISSSHDSVRLSFNVNHSKSLPDCVCNEKTDNTWLFF